jgi:hypothetical protein
MILSKGLQTIILEKFYFMVDVSKNVQLNDGTSEICTITINNSSDNRFIAVRANGTKIIVEFDSNTFIQILPIN